MNIEQLSSKILFLLRTRTPKLQNFQNSGDRHFSGLSTSHRFHVRGLLNPEATLHSSFQTPRHTCLFLIYVNAVQVKQNIFYIEIRANALKTTPVVYTTASLTLRLLPN
jgi:hypothetical protein